jgi:bifunctional DNase/RNase
MGRSARARPRRNQEPAMVKMVLSRIVIAESNDEQIIVLSEADGDRSFPIVIGVNEAFAIERAIRGERPPRPMTHDLLRDVIAGLGAEVERVVVTELRDHTFFAKVVLRCDGRAVDVDSRPSDAIALAVRAHAPIFVEDAVLDAVGMG